MIRAGARGYVTGAIPARASDGSAASRAAARSSRLLAGYVLDAFAGGSRRRIDPELDQLTPREQEVLRLDRPRLPLQGGRRRFSISVKTVEAHVGSVSQAALSTATSSQLGGSATAGRLGRRQALARLLAAASAPASRGSSIVDSPVAAPASADTSTVARLDVTRSVAGRKNASRSRLLRRRPARRRSSAFLAGFSAVRRIGASPQKARKRLVSPAPA